MIAVIGDIHGCYYTLIDLYSTIKNKYPDIDVYCVGDLIDRGNYSYEVFEFVINEKIKFTPGNHDYMFYYFINQPVSEIGRTWLYNGYETTMASYKNRMDKIPDHLQKISDAPLFLNLKDCFISHAGISKYYNKKLPKNFRNNLDSIAKIICSDLESEHSILWTRDELIDLGKLQVVGHTRKNEITYLSENNSVYIDTSVYTGNKLSAVIIDKNNIIENFSVQTYIKDID